MSFTKKMAGMGAAGFAGSLMVASMSTLAMGGQADAAKFEVASVRVIAADDSDGLKTPSGRGGARGIEVEHRRVNLRGLNLFALIVFGYGIKGCRPFGEENCILLSGGPEWLRKDAFDVVAKMPDDAPDYTSVQLMNGRAPQLQLMMQALLAERFHLQVHRETKEAPVFALTVGRKGLKMKKADGSEEPTLAFRPVAQPNGPKIIRVVGKNSSMQELADLYSKFMSRPVVDRTGLKDRYDFTVEYEADTDAPGPFAELTGPGLFRAFEAQAGLRLEAAKGPVEVLMIDRAERPAGN